MILLASQSARRIELLKKLGIPFEATASAIDESAIERSGLDPEKIATLLAQKKVEAQIHRSENFHAILGADTVVAIGENIYSKPESKRDAIRILNALRAKSHRVIGAISLYIPETRTFLEDIRITRVAMRNYSDEDIEQYVESGEPFGKAGAYAIQGRGCLLVDEITGDYLNVVGMSAVLLDELLEKAGIRSLLFSLK